MAETVQNVYKDGLCCGCGCCAGVCPQACIELEIDTRKGTYYPAIFIKDCISCGLCRSVCPGIDAESNSNIPGKWKTDNDHHPWLGYYRAIYLGYSQNPSIRQEGASGGIATSFLIHLLESGLVDGVVTTIMNSLNPLIAEPVISRTPEKILASQKSKYCPVPVGKILQKINLEDSRYALIGVPCVIQGIRKAQRLNKRLADRIPFLIGLFCSRTPSFHATNYILERNKILPGKIRRIEYRHGRNHIGSMRISLKNGKLKYVPHLDFDYWGYMFAKFFIPNRCFLCEDKCAAGADISFGDNWTPFLRHDEGSSSIIVRSESSLEILSELNKTGKIFISPAEIEGIVRSQGLPRKIQNARLRKWVWEKAGKPIPIGNSEPAIKHPLRHFIKSLPDLICFICSNRIQSSDSLHHIGKIVLLAERTVQQSFNAMRFLYKGVLESLRIFSTLIPVEAIYFNKKARFKIVMIGGYGSRDIGDESMPHADLLHFRKKLHNDLEIVMLSVNPEYTSCFHGERSIEDIKHIGITSLPGLKNYFSNLSAIIRIFIFLIGAYLLKRGIHLRLWPSAFNALREIDSADLLFNVGGGNLNSIIPQEFYKKGATFIAAKFLRKPVFLSGQTIGPFYGIRDTLFARLVLNIPKIITFRDREISNGRCRAIGIKSPSLIDAADDAMALPFLDKEEAICVLNLDPGVSSEWVNKPVEHIICMNLKGSLKLFTQKGKISDLSNITKKFSMLADMVLTRLNAKVLFIPTDYHWSVDDRNLHREIINRMNNKELVASLENEYDDCTLKGIINLCDIAVGARYHFCVFACALCKPFIGIASGLYQMTKLKGLSALAGIPELFYEEDLETSETEDIYNRIQFILENYNDIQKALNTIVPILKQNSQIAVNQALLFLEAASIVVNQPYETS